MQIDKSWTINQKMKLIHIFIHFKGLLERLAEGPIIGDGGFVFALEKRGYVKAGPWTPEAAVENPDAGNIWRHLHLPFWRIFSFLILRTSESK